MPCHKLQLGNLKIVSDLTSYLDMDHVKIPIVEYACNNKCNIIMEIRQFPYKVILVV